MKWLSIILIYCISAINLYGAAYEDIGSVRARGMGDAFESVEGGIDSIHYNPAGTAYLNSLQVLTEYGKPAIGFDDESSFNTLHFGVSVPFSKKPYLIFLNYLFKGLTIGNENFVVRDGSFSFLFHQFFVSDFYHERLFIMNIGKSLNNLFEGANIATGVNFKIFNSGFEQNEDTRLHPDPNLVDSTTGIGIDLGVTYDFSRYIRLSFVIANLLEPNISFFKDGEEYVNQRIKAGLAWKLDDIVFMQNLLASIGMVQISRDADDIRKSETVYKAGVEFWQWKRRIGFRLGFKTLFNVFSTGISYKHRFKNSHNVIFHYAFNYPFRSANIKNYFSLNYEFDFPDYYFDYRADADIEEENKIIIGNFKKGMVITKYKTLPNDNLYNISLIHYGTPDQAELLKKHNKIEDEKNLPAEMEILYDAKSFVTYKIKHGDTLELISRKLYNTTDKMDKIRRYNKIPFNKLRYGRILVIPMTKEDKEDWEKIEQKRKTENETKRLEEEKKKEETKKEEVKKKAGEEKKAEEIKKKEEEVKKKTEEEKKAEEEKKKEGEAEKKEEEAKVPTTEAAEPETKGEVKIHVIEAGDNLSKISSKYYGTTKYWEKIAEYNNIDPNKIRLGMKLKIPELSELEKK